MPMQTLARSVFFFSIVSFYFAGKCVSKVFQNLVYVPRLTQTLELLSDICSRDSTKRARENLLIFSFVLAILSSILVISKYDNE